MKTWKKNCEICGKEYIAHSCRGRFCPDCFNEGLKRSIKESKTIKTQTCHICGKTFECSPFHKYCPECLPDARRVLWHMKSRFKRLTCMSCGKPFTGYPGTIDCFKCRQANPSKPSHYEPQTLPDAKPKTSRKLMPPRECEWCGKTYTPRSGTQRFCSYRCANGHPVGQVSPVELNERRLARIRRDVEIAKVCSVKITRHYQNGWLVERRG